MNIIPVFEKEPLVAIPEENTTRRAQIPEWYYFPVFGQPRGVNISKLRELARLPCIDIPVTSITDEFARIKYKIVPIDEGNYSQANIEIVEKFFKHPNKNGETESHIRRAWARDLLQIDAGALTKVFTKGSFGGKKKESYIKNEYSGIDFKSGMIDPLEAITKEIKTSEKRIEKEFKPLKDIGQRELVELYSRDGSSFNVDADVTGRVHRYFQYNPKIPLKEPLVFDKDEIVYSMKNPRSYSFYGWAVAQTVETIALTIKSQDEYFLGYYKEKGIPDGVISILESNKLELKRLKEHWRKDSIGRRHKFAILGRDAKFTPMILTSRDMEVLSTQQWLYKVCMAMYHVNIPIMTLRGDAPKAGLEGMTQEEKMKALEPIISEWENKINNEVIPDVLQIPLDEVDVKYELELYNQAEDAKMREMQRADAQAGILTVNEIRAERGLDPVSWGDTPQNMFMPLNSLGNKPKPEVGGDE